MRPATTPTCSRLEVTRLGVISAAVVAVVTIERINGSNAASVPAQAVFVVLDVTEVGRSRPANRVRVTAFIFLVNAVPNATSRTPINHLVD
jgi:hypothetical protein